MNTRMLLLASGMISMSALAQNGDVMMKKFENQLPQSGRGNVNVAYQGKAIDQLVYDFMEEEGIPGMTLAIVQAPYIPRVVGYGMTDISKGNLASVKTIWPIGPIAQGFAAVTVMQLLEQGKLSLNDNIGKYISDAPDSWKAVTILQLLQHSSGIPDYRKNQNFSSSKDFTTKTLMDMANKNSLEFTPGTDVSQSATNFLLLTSIIEKVSKITYHDFVKKNQIDYLGLKQTFFGEDLSKIKQENVATTKNLHETFKHDKDYINPAETTTGYVEKDNTLVQVESQSASAFKGFSDVWASAENVSHWDIALAGSVLIKKPENRDIIYKPTKLANGKVVPAMAGWQFYGHKGLMDIKGEAPGHSAFLSRFTDASELVCVTLLANKGGVDLTNLARRIAASFDNTKLGTGANEDNLYTLESQFSVDETVANLERGLKELNVPLFAKFDHAANAQNVSLEMKPNQVLVFGSPKVGTALMIENPSFSIELPLRISVWEDNKGSVWVSFPQMENLAARYGLKDNQIVQKMQVLLQRLATKSSSVY